MAIYGEVITVESVKTVMCRKPHLSSAVLACRPDCALRQAVVNGNVGERDVSVQPGCGSGQYYGIYCCASQENQSFHIMWLLHLFKLTATNLIIYLNICCISLSGTG